MIIVAFFIFLMWWISFLLTCDSFMGDFEIWLATIALSVIVLFVFVLIPIIFY